MSPRKRTNLKPEERQNQLLDCAQTLFFTKGFEETTLSDILAAAKISKGGFYHHFKSKDELLFGVLDRMAADIFHQMQEALTDKSVPALDMLTTFLHLRANYLRAHDYPGQVELFRVMNDDKNMALLELFKRNVKRVSLPPLVEILAKGKAEGVFRIQSPEIAAELILYLSTFMDDPLKRAIAARATDRADAAADTLREAMALQFLTIDRVLGLPDGTTSFGWPEAVDETMATVPVELRGADRAE